MSFTPESGSTTSAIAVISGLAKGSNTVVLTQGASTGCLTVTNYPIEGPVLSGPWQTPFICQTQDFTLPDGTKYGVATDGTTCAAPTVIQYVYLKTGTTAFTAMASTTAVPADAATTTNSAGVQVPFIVRVETPAMGGPSQGDFGIARSAQMEALCSA